jgi:LPXTG-site transpeptidase (sortase) family protein
MTVVASAQENEPAPSGPEYPAPAPGGGGVPPEDGRPNEAPSLSDWTKRFLVRVSIAVLLIVGVVLLFDRGVTQVWYGARQRWLGSDFSTPRGHVAVGQAAALLQIPKIGLKLTVVQGDTASVLRGGPGHRPGTPMPGVRGNSVIFGHRHGWGGPFADLDQLHKNDLVVTKIRGGNPTVFKVLKVKQVNADDVQLLGASNDHRLTLVTGEGGTFSTKRLVVVAVSGTPGKLRKATGVHPNADNGSLILNPALGLAIVAFLAAWIAFAAVRRRYRLFAVLAVVGPLCLAGMLALFVAADRLLPPLR